MHQYRTSPQFSMNYGEIVIDNFAGGGGASTGIEMATGRSVDIAINHNPDAVAMHTINHPNTQHYCENVWDVDPVKACAGRPVGLAWFSPDCRHHSKAKGGKPVEKKIRGLAWIVLKWAALVKPRIIALENVEEFGDWGPLTRSRRPCKLRKGQTFQKWVSQLQALGYQVESRVLVACDYGAPTSRKRLFVIARRDGQPIVWPEKTHGPKGSGLKPYRTAAECIDWSIPCPSIFTRKKPLAENTLRRIARGLEKFVFNNADPFIIKPNHKYKYWRGQSIHKPAHTICNVNDKALVQPYVTRIGQTGWSKDRQQYQAEQPLTTITTKAEHCLVSAFLAKHFGGNYQGAGVDLKKPASTVTTVDHHALCTSHLIKFRGSNTGSKTEGPIQTISAQGTHIGEVRAFILKYYGTNYGHDARDPLQTITQKARFGIVTIHGEDYQIVDIGMRMLEPHELYRAQSFPEDYIFDRLSDGTPLTKAKQVAMCGNSVPPPIAEAIVRANYQEQQSAEAMNESQA